MNRVLLKQTIDKLNKELDALKSFGKEINIDSVYIASGIARQIISLANKTLQREELTADEMFRKIGFLPAGEKRYTRNGVSISIYDKNRINFCTNEYGQLLVENDLIKAIAKFIEENEKEVAQ